MLEFPSMWPTAACQLQYYSTHCIGTPALKYVFDPPQAPSYLDAVGLKRVAGRVFSTTACAALLGMQFQGEF